MNALPPPVPGDAAYVPDNLVWAILTTLFCCLPLGIVSIVYAAQVDGRRAAGDIAGAREAARKAGRWALWSAFPVPALFLLWFLVWFFVVGGLALPGNFSPSS